MERGSIFVLVFVVWMHMGFFNAKPLDDLIINLNLNESPKGDEQDDAHDYGNTGCNGESHGISCCEETFTTGDNDNGAGEIFLQSYQYKSNCPHSCKVLQDEKGTERGEWIMDLVGATESVKQKYTSGEGKGRNMCWCETKDVKHNKANQNYQTCVYRTGRNKSSVQENRYSRRKFTKQKNETIFDSAKNLTQLMKFAANFLIPHEIQNYMDNLNQEIDTISRNIVEWMSNDEKILIKRISTRMGKSHEDLYFLRQTLTTLAKETIRRSNEIIKLLKKLKQDDSEYNMKILQLSAKRMEELLKRSYGILEDAIKKFMIIVDDVELVKEDMRNLINKIGKMDDEENADLQSWIDTKRLEVYGGSASCAVFGPLAIISCPVTYATAAAILEPIINKENAKFKQLALAANEAENDAQRLFDKINEKAKYVRIESKLIEEWKGHISMVKDDLIELGPEDIEDFLLLGEDEDAIENLCNLTKACKDYIENHPPGMKIVSPPLHEACSAAGTP